MECGKYMNRKAYKMTLGLLYLLSLIALELWFLYACGILRGGMGLEGTDAIVIPLLPLWLASGVTALVWIFLRLAVAVEPLTDEDRRRPVLQRLSYLQLFACSGTLVGIMWGASFLLIKYQAVERIESSAWDVACIFASHFLTAALAAAFLYAGAHIRQVVVTLFCCLLFLLTIAANSIVINTAYYMNNPGQLDFQREQYNREHGIVQVPAETQEPTEGEEEEADRWTTYAASALVHYCYEYGEDSDTTPCFADRLLADYGFLLRERPDEDYADRGYSWLDGKEWIGGSDYYYLYKLVSLILGEGSEQDEEEVYRAVSEEVLPGVWEGLNARNLYPSSRLESLVNLLDYAYHDLQSPGDEKLETLYYLMSVQQIDTIAGNALLPYFGQPYAMLHSGFDDSHVLWAYSFWARRWHDGHIGLCRKLLDKVLEEYPNRSCTAERMKTTDRYYREKSQENKLTAADVLREIENAFGDVPRPDPQLPLMDPMEESDSLRALGEKYNRYTWQKLPAKIIHNGTEVLWHFIPRGFHYYLPAFLTEAVRNDRPEKGLDTLLIEILTYVHTEPEVRYVRFSLFSDEQGRAIHHFLQWMAFTRRDDESGPCAAASLLRQADESWWMGYE